MDIDSGCFIGVTTLYRVGNKKRALVETSARGLLPSYLNGQASELTASGYCLYLKMNGVAMNTTAVTITCIIACDQAAGIPISSTNNHSPLMMIN